MATRFEWDPQKNEANIRRHGFDFADAEEVFKWPMLTWFDTRHDYGEDRYCSIGLSNGRIVNLVFTERDHGKTVRIISMRKAERNERKRYQSVLADGLGEGGRDGR